MKNPLYNAWHSLWHDPAHFVAAVLYRINGLFPDEMYLRMVYRLECGRRLNLTVPQRYNEKLQWIKLYYHNPQYTLMADKIRAKEIAATVIGESHIIPTLGVWKRAEDIDWDSLPEKVVLKTNHDSGNSGVVVINTPEKRHDEAFRRKTIKRLNASLRKDAFAEGREWPYKNIPRKVFAEQYVEDATTQDLRDYKFYCIDGKVVFLFVATERNIPGEIAKFDYFDRDFKPLDLKMVHPRSKNGVEKPVGFEQMVELAEQLSHGIPTVRIDLYAANGQIFFGEYTFFPSGGMAPFYPDEWDLRLGEMVKLPEKIV